MLSNQTHAFCTAGLHNKGVLKEKSHWMRGIHCVDEAIEVRAVLVVISQIDGPPLDHDESLDIGDRRGKVRRRLWGGNTSCGKARRQAGN